MSEHYGGRAGEWLLTPQSRVYSDIAGDAHYGEPKRAGVPYAREIPLMALRTEYPVLSEQVLWEWSQRGIKQIGDLYEVRTLQAFDNLIDDYGIRRGDFLNFGTIGHSLRNCGGRELLNWEYTTVYT